MEGCGCCKRKRRAVGDNSKLPSRCWTPLWITWILVAGSIVRYDSTDAFQATRSMGGATFQFCQRSLEQRSMNSISTTIHDRRGRGRGRPCTRQYMVLTTPESIIEQASTQRLLDDLIDESVRISARRPIMMQFDPSSGWIWKRWKGTIFSETWDSCVAKMLYAAVIFVLCRTYPKTIQPKLSGFNILWGQLLSVTTFTLTFFVNQSYVLWRKCYDLSRRLQGRLHDLGLALAAHATRRPTHAQHPRGPTSYTAESRQILEVVGRYVRLFNLLTYASFTRSHRPILTPRGMRRLVERGLMTPGERQILIDADVPATQRHNCVLLWITRCFVEGRAAGHFMGGPGFEDQFMEKIHVCRAQYGAIGDELQGRMPLAYAHIVQVLVDLVLYLYPFMAVTSGMSGTLCVIGTGLLTIGYQGLFDLAKQFLDPYDNESYGKGDDPLVVDTLIAETNAGSVRWMQGLAQMPLATERFEKGELDDHILPLRGFSVEELEQRERERLEQEKELQEKRDREEATRHRAEKRAQLVRAAAEAMIPAMMSHLALGKLRQQRLANDKKSNYIFHRGPSRTVKSLRDVAMTINANITSVENVAYFVGNVSTIPGAIPSSLVPEGTAAMRSRLKVSVVELKEKVEPMAKAEGEAGMESLTASSASLVPEMFGLAQKLDAVVAMPSMARNEPQQHVDSIDSIFIDVVPSNTLEKDESGEWNSPKGRGPFPSTLASDDEMEAAGMVGNEYSGVQPTPFVFSNKTSADSMKKDLLKSQLLSVEDYQQRVAEILQAERDERLETEAILRAPCAADSVDLSTLLKSSKEKRKKTDKGTRTNASGDGTHDIQDLAKSSGPRYEGNVEYLEDINLPIFDPTKPVDLGKGDVVASESRTGCDSISSTSAETQQLEGISRMWEETLEKAIPQLCDGEDVSFTVKPSRPSDLVCEASERDHVAVEAARRRTTTLEEVPPQMQSALAVEDRIMNAEDMAKAERLERLETAAILSAPPAAEMIEVPKLKEEMTSNIDDLSILEMDVANEADYQLSLSMNHTEAGKGTEQRPTEPLEVNPDDRQVPC